MATDKVTLKDAVVNVELELLNEVLVADEGARLEAASRPLHCNADFDTNFGDRAAFITGVSKYTEEATRHAHAQGILEEGLEHAGDLYTWRCCSRAVPMAKSNDQPNRAEINMSVVEVLAPEVDKLFALYSFSQLARECLCDEARRLCHVEKRKEFVSEAYLLVLAKLLDMFVVLDELKNMKASIKNDLSTYRRAVQALQSQTSGRHSLVDIHSLSIFLAEQNNIKEELKKDLQKIDGYEELLSDIINICVQLYEEKQYLKTSDKHMFIKATAFCVTLIDSGGPLLAKLESKKRIAIGRLDRMFKSVEIVALYGDMQIQPFAFVRRSPAYDPSRWPLCHHEGDSCHVSVVHRVATIRSQHDSYVATLARINNDLSMSDALVQGREQSDELCSVALSGIQLLCVWTADVVETMSWKLLHPVHNEEAEEYARATKFNYSAAEKSALVEIVSMVKAVQCLLCKMEPTLSHAIRRHIYSELQLVVQGGLAEPIHKAVKAKKDILTSVLQSVRDCCMDSLSGSLADPRSSSEKVWKKRKDEGREAHQPRSLPPAPGSTQLYVVRTLLEALVSDKISGGKKILKKELDVKTIECIRVFLKRSYHWHSLIRLYSTINEAAELSQLWFREFYLEMTMGKRIQFPIDMSMPWILTDHVLSLADPPLAESILYQLDLYNDAAQFALLRFRKQFLYDEVEAEVNLCFDQFVFKLSDEVFTHYKQLAASQLLDKRFKSDCSSGGVIIRTPAGCRFHSLLSQRHLQLLGRSIDLNRLVSQRINVALLKALDIAIWRFEAEQLSSIVELWSLVEVNRLAHSLLTEHLHSLSPFEDLLQEANHSVSQPHGRITLHIFWELNYDFVPNFIYNDSTHRFVRAEVNFRNTPSRERPPPTAHSYVWGSKSLNIAFANIFHALRGFIGMPHLQVMIRFLEYKGLAVILEELLKMTENIVNDKIRRHFVEVRSLLPKSVRLPRSDYGSAGMLQYWLHHLEAVAVYRELKGELCHDLRQLGNIVVLWMQMEMALGQEETADLHMGAPFTGSIPQPPARNLEEQKKAICRLEEKYSRIQLSRVAERVGSALMDEITRESELMTKERLCCGLSLFDMLLLRLKGILEHDSVWMGGDEAPPNGVMAIDDTNDFHRFWSAVQFFVAVAPSGEESSVESLFGDSVHWGAISIIFLLGQIRRFEVLDFCYHLLRMQRIDGKQDVVNGVPLVSMVERIRRIQMLNNNIITILTSSFSEQEEESVREFAPPMHPSICN